MVREEYYVSVVEFKDEKNSESQVDMFISFFFFLSLFKRKIDSKWGDSSEIFDVYLERGHEETLRVQILLNVILLVDGGGGAPLTVEREREKGKPIWEFSPLSFVTFPMKNARQLHHRIKN